MIVIMLNEISFMEMIFDRTLPKVMEEERMFSLSVLAL